jgi:diaminopimelate epimerase
MDFDFYKIQTAGNDLILANFSGKSFPETEELREIGKMVCRRDYGIGGNGFIAVKDLSRDNLEAFFLDPSGSFSDTTTDAAICFSRFIFDSGSAGKEDFTLKINSNEHAVGIIDSYNFRLSLGHPLTVSGKKYIEHPDSEYINTIRSGGKDFPVTELYLQKFGVVVFSENRGIDQLKEISEDIFKSTSLSSDFRLISGSSLPMKFSLPAHQIMCIQVHSL